MVQKPVTHRAPRRSMETARVARSLALPPDAKRPSRVSPCRKSAVRCLTPTVASCLKSVTNFKSREVLAREVARVQCQPAGKGEDKDTSDESEAPLVPMSAQVVSGRRHHRLRNLVDHLMCRDGEVGGIAEAKCCKDTRSTAGSSNRSWQVLQVCKEARVPPCRKRQSQRCLGCVSERLLCLGISTSPWFTASCCHDCSLAVSQPLWVQPTAEESSTCGSVHPLSAGNAHTPIKIAGKEKEGSCPIACATSPHVSRS